MRHFLAIVALATTLVALTPASAAPETESVQSVVAGVKSTYTNVSSIRADFTQTVKSAAMGAEMHQRGKITLERPRKMRIEVGVPMESAVISDGKTLWVYSVVAKSVTVTPDMGGQGDMSALLDDLSKLDELFDVKLVEDKPPKPTQTVSLAPRKPGNFKSMQLSLLRQKFTLTDLVMVDQFDTVTSMSFTNVRMNQDVPDSDFAFVAPAGVQVIRTDGN